MFYLIITKLSSQWQLRDTQGKQTYIKLNVLSPSLIPPKMSRGLFVTSLPTLVVDYTSCPFPISTGSNIRSMCTLLCHMFIELTLAAVSYTVLYAIAIQCSSGVHSYAVNTRATSSGHELRYTAKSQPVYDSKDLNNVLDKEKGPVTKLAWYQS